MSRSDTIKPPGWGTTARAPGALLKSIDDWVGNPALAALVSCFGGDPEPRPTADMLDWLDHFSAEHWDFRGGQERNLARAAEFDEPTTRTIMSAAEALGMTDPLPPSRRSYSHVLVLGGLVRACLVRPVRAAELVQSGIRTRSVSALSAYRPLGGDEHGLIEQLGLKAKQNEMQVMEEGLVRAFKLGRAVDDEPGNGLGGEFATSLVRTWVTDRLEVRLIVAPSSDPTSRRANTADTYGYWAENCAHLSEDDVVLLVTSTIYLPQQHVDAVRILTLRYGCAVETVGLDAAKASLGALRQSFTPANYLQEVRSAIRAVRALRSAAASVTFSGPS